MVKAPSEKRHRNLRRLIFLLPAIAIIVALTSAYFHYSVIKEDSLYQVHREVEKNLKVLGSHIETKIAWAQKVVHTLSENRDIESLLSNQNKGNLDSVNAVLDSFAETTQADVCYLMDRNGNTIASSNRNAEDSFVGKNYRFRPYFKNAIENNPSCYMALGIVSFRRGIYFSHPVYEPGQTLPKGVAVIKT